MGNDCPVLIVNDANTYSTVQPLLTYAKPHYIYLFFYTYSLRSHMQHQIVFLHFPNYVIHEEITQNVKIFWLALSNKPFSNLYYEQIVT